MLKPSRKRSHLLQMRGLKLISGYLFTNCAVASFTDAWIETRLFADHLRITLVASFTDAWIETDLPVYSEIRGTSRIFYRCVD